jgi:hypothetical protein
MTTYTVYGLLFLKYSYTVRLIVVMVHEHTDEKCLELAADIRVILVELSELLGHALKDEKELKEAVARLMRQP